MAVTRVPPAPSFARRLPIETPEHVVLELELAGVGSRAAAAVCDSAILFLLVLGLFYGLSALGPHGRGRWASLLAVLAIVGLFTIVWGYFLLFEALNEGRTPGKRLIGIRVVMDTGHPVTFAASAIRNLVRVVDAQPGFAYLVGLMFALFHSQNRRLGDIVAGTVVVRDRPDELLVTAGDATAAPEPIDLGPPDLTDEEFRLLDQFLDRADGLDPVLRSRFIQDLAARFSGRFPRRDPDPNTFLALLHSTELAKRRSRLAIRSAEGIGRSTVTAERFVVQKRERWEAFRTRAAKAGRSGLRHLAPAEIPGFAAQYREVAADLARARTYRVDTRVIEYLERLVSAGHNAIYGGHAVPRAPRFARLVLRDCPAAVYRARRYVLAALLIFALPALTGYRLIRERPPIAEEILPGEMIARAREGAERRGHGIGYAQAPSMFLPVVASRIITNNVQVAFFAFAFGITAGLGTFVLLALNGLFLGATVALFQNYGVAGWLLTFVAGHGVLELTAIFIAGGAGFLVARALIAPGDVTRADALVVEGATAIRMIGATVSLLVLAGLIEGLLSASDAPPAFKFGVSAASAVLLILYFRNGAASATTRSGGGGTNAAAATSARAG